MLDYSRCRLLPYAHQRVGIEALVNNAHFALFDEMGAGKTKQVIDAAQFLFLLGVIKRVIVVAPAAVRGVWYDRELGELQKHLWESMAATVTEFHTRTRTWVWNPSKSDGPRLDWLITNYEFLRSDERLGELLPLCGPETLLVLDESSAVKNHQAEQTKSCIVLRYGTRATKKASTRPGCGRVVLLNGTPIANNPLDLFTQGNLVHPSIFANTPTFIHFRGYYAIMGGYSVKGRPVEVVGWQRLEELQGRLAPYVLRRLKKDCLDLPPKLAPVSLTATLSEKTWKVYKEMRDEMVTWLNSNDVVIVQQAFTKYLRLAQITSGFVGGIDSDGPSEPVSEGNVFVPPFLANAVQRPIAEMRDEFFEDIETKDERVVRLIGEEKQNVFLDWFAKRLEAEPNAKTLAWCRFRPEVDRLAHAVREKFPHVEVGKIYGDQTRAEREHGKRLLTPETAPDGPALTIGTPSTGSMGLSLVAADAVVYVSQDYRLMTRMQSEDRVHRPGQTRPVSYFDIVATGPKGQKTVDHIIVRALRDKQNLAEWTSKAWVSALLSE